MGSNRLAIYACLILTDPAHIVAETYRILRGESDAGRIPELWNGHAAERIVEILRDWGDVRRSSFTQS